MANHASAEKRNRQRIKRTAKNRAVKSSVRTTVKKARSAFEAGAVEGGAETSAELLKKAASALDRAATKGVIPAKRASRLKGRLAAAAHKAAKK